MKIIYDFGAHNGNDIPYYLTKADKVVAVEANPVLAAHIEQRFAKEIQEGRVIVEACAIVTTRQETVEFFVHTNDVQSSIKPVEGAHTKHQVPAKNVLDLITEHGKPYFIKIDLEFFDAVVLEYLLENSIKPPYISVEAHTIDVFCLLVVLGKYNKFKLVDGRTVNEVYPEFAFHSAGPFGEDVDGPWLDSNAFFNVLADHRLGWKDIHAAF